MARSRNIKPGFFSNEVLAELPPLTRLMFIGLWCLADREGRLQDRPKRIKHELLGYDDVTSAEVDQMLQQLHDNDFIIRYEVAGERYIQVTNFKKHQNPHCREQESTIPAPGAAQMAPAIAAAEDAGEPEKEHDTADNLQSTVQAQCKHDTSIEQARLIPDSLNLIPDTLKTLSCANGQAQEERGPVDGVEPLTVVDHDHVKGRVASREGELAVTAEETEGGIGEAPDEKGAKRQKSPDWKTAKAPLEIRFCKFWDAYPNVRNTGKYPCWKKFKKLRVDDDLLNQMLAALEVQKRSRQWQRDGGRYVPNPLTWLNQQRWEDVQEENDHGGTQYHTAGFHTQAEY